VVFGVRWQNPGRVATLLWGERMWGEGAVVPRESGVGARSSLCHRSPKCFWLRIGVEGGGVPLRGGEVRDLGVAEGFGGDRDSHLTVGRACDRDGHATKKGAGMIPAPLVNWW
jgi:hypothetical protein